MFCMNCGQKLPDGAKFCLNCGTPQGAVSPSGTTQTETIGLDGTHTFVPAMCPNCNANMRVDTSLKVVRCNTCGTECLVQDAIRSLTVRGNIQVENSTINVSGTNIDSLLKRVEIMIEDDEFKEAKSKCNTILDLDPTNGKVYFYLLLADMYCCSGKSLVRSLRGPFDRRDYYSKTMKYADSELKKELQDYTDKYYAILDDNLKNPRVGAVILFGHNDYGQSAFWEILQILDDKLLIIWYEEPISKEYHDRRENITWADCTLREWLNKEFIQGHFTPEEQARILPCKHNNANSSEFNTPGGVPTTDKVFLLSIDEVKPLTLRARGGGYYSGWGTFCSSSRWWLRSPGPSFSNSSAAYVDYRHQIRDQLVYEKADVFPALWLKR